MRIRTLSGETFDAHPDPATIAPDARPVGSDAATAPVTVAPSAPAGVAHSSIYVRGKHYSVGPSDALALFGALALALDEETASVTLASGDVLQLTHRDVSDIGRQLAGKPADEVLR